MSRKKWHHCGNGTEKQQHIINQEMQANNIKWMHKKIGHNVTTQLWTKMHGQEKTITDPRAIEKACIAENIAKFSQIQECPPLQQPLVRLLGYQGEGQSNIVHFGWDLPNCTN